MFKKLKECKTLKEIFVMIGTKPFEKIAFVVVILWCLLPAIVVGERVYWSIVATSSYQKVTAFREFYKFTVWAAGYLTVYIAAFFLFGRIAVYGKRVFKKVKEEPWHFWLLLMLLWSCVSTLLAEDVKLAYEGDAYLAEGLRNYFFYAGVYICSFIILNKKAKAVILNIFNVVANIISFIIIIVDMTDIAFLDKCFSIRLSGVFFHYNHAGYYINMGILCAMGLYLYEKSRKLRIWYLISMILQIYGILVNSTLGSFLGTCGALVFILVMYLRSQGHFAKRMLTPVIVMIALIVASYFGYVPTSTGEDMKYNFEILFDSGKTLVTQEGNMDGVGNGRMLLWKQSLKMIPGKPIFGYGPEHLDKVHSQEMWIARPDNEIIQHAVFLGVPAAIYYVISLIWLFVVQWKQMKKLDNYILIAAGCMVAYIISGMFGVTTFYTTPYLYLFWGMAAGRNPKKQEQIEEEMLQLKTEIDEVLEKRLLEPKKDKKKRKNNNQETEIE